MDNKNNNKDFEYTIVMDASYTGPNLQEDFKGADPAQDLADEKKDIERLYDAYERMALLEPTVLDVDDAYPHTYQWRMGDRYDPDKVEVVKAALKERKRISDTEAYQTYLDKIKNLKFKPESWD